VSEEEELVARIVESAKEFERTSVGGWESFLSFGVKSGAFSEKHAIEAQKILLKEGR
jgi:hypothetical protein